MLHADSLGQSYRNVAALHILEDYREILHLRHVGSDMGGTGISTDVLPATQGGHTGLRCVCGGGDDFM
jgi:hypothetical protein